MRVLSLAGRWCIRRTELSQKPQRIIEEPAFNDLPSRDPKEIGAKPLHQLTSRSYSFEFPSMSALDRVPNHDLISFRQDLSERDVEIRKGGEAPAHVLFQPCTTNPLPADDKVFDEYLVKDFQVCLIEPFVYPPPNKSFVLF